MLGDTRKTLTNSLRVNQINIGGCLLAAQELRKTNADNKIDITLLQEPYSYRGKAHGFGFKNRIVAVEGEGNYKSPDAPRAAIVISNPNIDVLRLDKYMTTHCAAAVISTTDKDFIVASVYCQYRHELDQYLELMEEIATDNPAIPIIIGTDINAYSPLWHELRTDKRARQRGLATEVFLARNDLRLANKPQTLTTFKGRRTCYRNVSLKQRQQQLDAPKATETNVDITIYNGKTEGMIQDWRVLEGPEKADHREIRFQITNAVVKSSKKIPGYVTRKANWEAFERMVAETQPIDQTQDRDSTIANITATLTEICDKTLKRKRIKPDAVPWWTDEHTSLNRDIGRARRKYQKLKKIWASTPTYNADDPPPYEITEAIADLKRAHKAFDIAAYKGKRQSLREYTTKIGNGDPFGPIYKQARGKIGTPTVMSSLKETNGSANPIDSLMALATKMFPDDDTTTDSPNNANLRTEMEHPPPTPNTDPITEEEVFEALTSMRRGKAPGPDNLDADILMRSWSVWGEPYTVAIENAREYGVFPDAWKEGKLIILPKPGKDPASVKGYRPITLLPVMGKIFEKVIARRLTKHLTKDLPEDKRLCDTQFGFTKNKGTDDALTRLQELLYALEGKKFIAGLFVDISGAFDNAWTPKILQRLKELECPQDIYLLIKSYLNGRRVNIGLNQREFLKYIAKGCPQGSILGPLLWNIIFDEILKILRLQGFQAIAYADDLLVIVSADTITDLRNRLNDLCSILYSWSRTAKLEVSEEKTKIMIFKGTIAQYALRIYLNPDNIIRHRGLGYGAGCVPSNKIEIVDEYQYLGVLLTNSQNYEKHVERAGSKAAHLFTVLRQSCGRDWGLNFRSLRILYKGVFLPTVTYGAAFWGHVASKRLIKEKLRSHQRGALLTVLRAYRSVSTISLIAIAGVLPLELEIRIVGQLAQKRVQMRAENKDEIIVRTTLHNLKQTLLDEAWAEWQTEWENAIWIDGEKGTKSQYTRDLIPNVRDWARARHRPCHFMTQALTGHGNFKFYITYRGLGGGGYCSCGKLQTANHILGECSIFRNRRESFLREINIEADEFQITDLNLLDRNVYTHFARYVKEVLLEKEEMDRTHATKRSRDQQ